MFADCESRLFYLHRLVHFLSRERAAIETVRTYFVKHAREPVKLGAAQTSVCFRPMHAQKWWETLGTLL